MRKTDIIDLIGPERYAAACHAAWQDSARADYGRMPELTDDLDDVTVDINTSIWWDNQDVPVDTKLAVVFEIYADMPCYAYLSWLPFRRLTYEQRLRCLTWLRECISSSDDAIANPARYTLWCDFFENPQAVEETWNFIIDSAPSEIVLERVLMASGPVPYALKHPLYLRLISEERWHDFIFCSLLHSAFDVYGSIDKSEARRILDQLILPTDTLHLDRLKQELNS